MKKFVLIILLVLLSTLMICCVMNADGKNQPITEIITNQDTIKNNKDTIKTLDVKEQLLKENNKRHIKIDEHLQKLQEQQELLDSLLKKKKNG